MNSRGLLPAQCPCLMHTLCQAHRSPAQADERCHLKWFFRNVLQRENSFSQTPWEPAKAPARTGFAFVLVNRGSAWCFCRLTFWFTCRPAVFSSESKSALFTHPVKGPAALPAAAPAAYGPSLDELPSSERRCNGWRWRTEPGRRDYSLGSGISSTGWLARLEGGWRSYKAVGGSQGGEGRQTDPLKMDPQLAPVATPAVQGPGCRRLRMAGCQDCVSMVSGQCHHGVRMVSPRCQDGVKGVTRVSGWCQDGVRRCPRLW